MRIDSAFEVPVGVDEVWVALLDVERIAPCLPGASVDAGNGDGEYRGSMRIKLGPVTSAFEGTLRITEADEAARRVVIDAAARDARGQGAAAATITSTLEPGSAGTRVAVQTELKLAGTAAQFGRGVVNDVSQKLMAEFAQRLAAEIEHPTPRAAPATGGSPGRPAEPGPVEERPPAAGAGRVDENVLDLTAAGRDALLKRAALIAAGVAALLAFRGLFMRGRGRGPKFVIKGPLLVIDGRSRRQGGR
jgi:carbon monoxide dehydrogenase subunit G